jgi:hypothetical protein
MARSKQSLKAKLSESYAGLTDREQKLVMAMGIILPLLAVALVIGIFSRSLSDIESQARGYENSLDLLVAGAPAYLENQRGGEADGGLADLFTEEVLEDNPVKLTSFIASKATAAGVSVSSYDTEEIPIGSSSAENSEPIIVERRVTVDIRDAQHDDMLEFLEEIETSGEPVVIQRIDLRGKSREPGGVRARVEVSTFVKRNQQS